MSNDPLSINVKPVRAKNLSIGPYFVLSIWATSSSGGRSPGTELKQHSHILTRGPMEEMKRQEEMDGLNGSTVGYLGKTGALPKQQFLQTV